MTAGTRYPYRRTRGATATPAGPMSLYEAIDQHSPLLWYKTDETSGTLASSGSVSTALDNFQGTAPTYSQDGPETGVTKGIDWSAANNWARNTTTGMPTTAAGTIIVFAKQATGSFNSTAWFSQANTSNFVQVLFFGVNPESVGSTHRLGIAAFTTSASNRRVAYGSTDTSTLINTGWHMFAVTQDGTTGFKLYIDGVAETVTDATNGTPPAITAWTSTLNNANSRIVMGQSIYGSASSNSSATVSNICLFDFALSAAQLLEIAGFMT